MYAFVEEPSRTHCDSSVHSLSWMGKAPDGQPESGTAWRLTENSYYDDGWLASGNSRGVVGVTMTGCRSAQNSSVVDVPLRTNFNLRGHRSEVGVTIVKLDFVAAFLMRTYYFRTWHCSLVRKSTQCLLGYCTLLLVPFSYALSQCQSISGFHLYLASVWSH